MRRAARCLSRFMVQLGRRRRSDGANQLQTDRDMEYVHLKVTAAAAPSRSTYCRRTYQDGLAYYESTKEPLRILHRLFAEGGVCLRIPRAGALEGRIPDRLREYPMHVRSGPWKADSEISNRNKIKSYLHDADEPKTSGPAAHRLPTPSSCSGTRESSVLASTLARGSEVWRLPLHRLRVVLTSLSILSVGLQYPLSAQPSMFLIVG